MINVELLQKALDHITAHPEEWNQRVYAARAPSDAAVGEKVRARLVDSLNVGSCGTAFCLAGHVAVTFLGREPLYDDEYDFVTLTVKPLASEEPEVYICDLATSALGLTSDQSDALFHSENTLAVLWGYAWHYTEGKVVVPMEFDHVKQWSLEAILDREVC